MSDANSPYWSVTLEIPKSQIPFRYKYVIVDENNGSNVMWEDEGVKDLVFSEKNAAAAIVNDGSFRVCTLHIYMYTYYSTPNYYSV